MVADTELYDLLNCAPDASPSELKAAYRKASLANHPDKNPGNEEAASARFQEIGAAYEILSDPDQRAAYDRYGKEQPGMGGMGGMGGGPDMDDIFAEMFGGGRGGGRGRPPPRRRPKKGQDSRIQYAVTLQDLYNGRTAHFNLKRDRFCGSCGGSGGRPGAKPQPCVKCGGEGRVRQLRDMGGGMVAQSFGTCNACEGEGEKVREKERCKKCKGAKVRQEATKLDIVIERGMHDGQCIVCKGENDQEPGVPEAGDLIFQLSLQEDPSFSLNGLDLLCTCRLTLSEALLGFDRTVLTHLDGRQIRVERRAGAITRPGDVQRVRGEGMMTQGDRGERGDLYIRWEIDFPPDNFLSDVDSLKLAHLLPPKRPSPPADATTTVETVAPETAPLEEFGRNALPSQEHEWEDDDMSAGGGGGGGPQCAHQ